MKTLTKEKQIAKAKKQIAENKKLVTMLDKFNKTLKEALKKKQVG